MAFQILLLTCTYNHGEENKRTRSLAALVHIYQALVRAVERRRRALLENAAPAEQRLIKVDNATVVARPSPIISNAFFETTKTRPYCPERCSSTRGETQVHPVGVQTGFRMRLNILGYPSDSEK